MVIAVIVVLVIVFIFTKYQEKGASILDRVIPGATTRSEIYQIMGDPDQIRFEEDLEILYYQQKIKGWFSIRFWIEPLNDQVIAIQAQTDDYDQTQDSKLIYWVNQYGVPDIIAWTYGNGYRHLAWPNRGISIITFAHKNLDKQISELFIYMPIPISEYINKAQKSLFLKDLSPNNLFERGTTDNPDLTPLDPFDWSMSSTSNSK